MIKACAYLGWTLDVQCPHCSQEIDLVEYDSENDPCFIAEKIFEGLWNELRDYKVECTNCHEEFQLECVIY